MKRPAIAAVGLVLAVVLAFGAGAFALHVWPGGEDSEAPATISKDEPILTRAAVQEIVTSSLSASVRARIEDIEAEYLGYGRWQVRLALPSRSALFEYNEHSRRVSARNAFAKELIGE